MDAWYDSIFMLYSISQDDLQGDWLNQLTNAVLTVALGQNLVRQNFMAASKMTDIGSVLREYFVYKCVQSQNALH